MNNEDYLAHHGILGMKWGIRRYRNKDGSLTDAGKKRYGKRKLKPIFTGFGTPLMEKKGATYINVATRITIKRKNSSSSRENE